jgi:hypothetical protein
MYDALEELNTVSGHTTSLSNVVELTMDMDYAYLAAE